jgi:ribosomal protein S7
MVGTYIPENQRDHRYGIFHVVYLCKIPYIHTRSIEDLRRFGMPSSGYKEFDVGQEHQLEDRYLTINQMLQFWLDGVTVRVSKYEDTAKIYNAISEYLQHWLNHIRKTFSTNHVPVDDLQVLDNFANVVYDKAKYNFTTEIVESAMLKKIDEVSIVNFDTILAPPKPEVKTYGGQVEEEEPQEPIEMYPKRDGMGQLFSEVRAKQRRKAI